MTIDDRFADEKSNMRTYIILILIFNSLVAIAQPKAAMRLEKDSMLIGDQINVEFTVKHPQNVAIFMPKGINLGDKVEIINEGETSKIEKNNEVLTSKTVTITAFDSGKYTIPSVPVEIEEDGKRDTIYSNILDLIVTSPIIDTTKTIAPIKDIFQEPLFFKEDILPVILVVLGIFGIILLIYLLRKYRKNQIVEDVKPIVIPPKPAHIIAYAKLNDLENQQLWQQGNFKKHHSEASYILREYLENRYEILALESVTDEILRDLTVLKLDNHLMSNLRKLLQTADLVKFAKVIPTETEHRAAIDLTRQFIDVTKVEEVEKVIESGF